jgi:putrescine aminotransferase
VNNQLTEQEIKEARADAEAHFWPQSRQAGDVSAETGIKLVTEGKGVWVTDADGDKWFDTMSSLWLVNIGHGRREIADAVYRQMVELSFSPSDTVSPVTARLAARLSQLSRRIRALGCTSPAAVRNRTKPQ